MTKVYTSGPPLTVTLDNEDVAKIHRLLDSVGVPSAVGESCMVDDCGNQVHHRVHTLINAVGADNLRNIFGRKVSDEVTDLKRQIEAMRSEYEAKVAPLRAELERIRNACPHARTILLTGSGGEPDLEECRYCGFQRLIPGSGITNR